MTSDLMPIVLSGSVHCYSTTEYRIEHTLVKCRNLLLLPIPKLLEPNHYILFLTSYICVFSSVFFHKIICIISLELKYLTWYLLCQKALASELSNVIGCKWQTQLNYSQVNRMGYLSFLSCLCVISLLCALKNCHFPCYYYYLFFFSWFCKMLTWISRSYIWCN